VKTEHHSF